MKKTISYSDAQISKDDLIAISKAAKDGWGSNCNKYIDIFEKKFAKLFCWCPRERSILKPQLQNLLGLIQYHQWHYRDLKDWVYHLVLWEYQCKEKLIQMKRFFYSLKKKII